MNRSLTPCYRRGFVSIWARAPRLAVIMANYQARNTSWCSLSSLVEKTNYLASSLANRDKGRGLGASCRVGDLYHVMKCYLIHMVGSDVCDMILRPQLYFLCS